MRGVVQQDAEIGYRLVPGYTGKGENPIHVAINSLGFRDREYDLTGADANRRFVLAAGDSFSFGAVVELDQTYLSYLETSFQKEDPSWTIVKTGVPGYSLLQSVATVRRHVDRFRPEFVIIQTIPETEGRNFLPQQVVGGMIVVPKPGWHYQVVEDQIFDSPFPPGIFASVDLLAYRISNAYRLGRRVVVARMHGDLSGAELVRSRSMGLEALAGLNRDLRQRGIPLLVVLNNWAQETAAGWDAVKGLNEEYAHFCRQNEVPVLDTLSPFKAETERSGYQGRSAGDRHWSVTGHRFASELIATQVRGLGWASPRHIKPDERSH